MGNNPVSGIDEDGGENTDFYLNKKTGNVEHHKGETGNKEGYTWLAKDGATFNDIYKSLDFLGLKHQLSDGQIQTNLLDLQQKGKMAMEIFSPDNIGAILMLGEGSAMQAPLRQVGKKLVARTLTRTFDELIKGLPKNSVGQGVKYINETGNIKEAFNQLQKAGYIITKSSQGRLFLKNIHNGETLMLRNSKSGNYSGYDTIMRMGNGKSKNEMLYFENSTF